jgi:hypothetical protein
MRTTSLKLITVYKRFFAAMNATRCRFIPTCSEYTYQAIQKHGFFGGCFRGFFRILRCNPFNRRTGRDEVKENYRGEAKWLL